MYLIKYKLQVNFSIQMNTCQEYLFKYMIKSARGGKNVFKKTKRT